MNTLKTIGTCCFLIKNTPSPFSLTRRLAIRQQRWNICLLSNSDESGSGSSSSSEGDKRKQELLVRIAMLQTQKVRLTDFLDERSGDLTQYAEDANAEFDEIGAKAMKELDQVSDKITEKLEDKMQAMEEAGDINREEIERNEKVLEEFEEQIQRERNEGLFFKNLGDKQPPQAKTAEAKLEAQKLREQVKENAGSKLRRYIYLGLMSLLALSIANAVLASAEIEWRKVAILVFILMGLIAQYIYEQSLSSNKQGKR